MKRVNTLYHEFDKYGDLVVPNGENIDVGTLLDDDDHNDMSFMYKKVGNVSNTKQQALTLIKT